MLALDGAMACLALVAAITVIAISPASADNSANIPPALKCADLAALKMPGRPRHHQGARDARCAAGHGAAVAAIAGNRIGGDAVVLPRGWRDRSARRCRRQAYAIGFAIALPDRWNGRFLFQGGGGLNGSIRPPLGYQAAGEVPALARGFAVVSTDSGHQGAVFDGSFLKDQEAALNFANASVGKVTIAAKAIVAHYYGQPARRSYFTGCSTGGREGMLASARYPEQFDGIVAGAPAMRTGNSNIGLAWANAAFSQIAPKDASGKPEPAKTFSAGERKLITKAILDACDAKDGVKDGMIFDGKACQFDPAVARLQRRRRRIPACRRNRSMP